MKSTYTDLVLADRISDGKWRLRWRVVQEAENGTATVEVTLNLQRGPAESVSDVELRCARRGYELLEEALRDHRLEPKSPPPSQ